MNEEMARPFPLAPLVATVLLVGLTIWALVARKRR
jgi:hypothetical protein